MARKYFGVELDSGPTTRPVRGKSAKLTGPATRPVRKAKPVPAAASAPAKKPAPSRAVQTTKKPVARPEKGAKKRSDGAGRDKWGQWNGPGGDRR